LTGIYIQNDALIPNNQNYGLSQLDYYHSSFQN